MMRNLLSVLVFVLVCQTAMAQQICTKDGCFGSGILAARLNARGVLQHDTSYAGPEVLFQSSGVATEQQAIEYWRQSPGHAALLPSITEIECVGGTCVGRGEPLSSGPIVASRRTPVRAFLGSRPLLKIGKRFKSAFCR